MAVKPKLALIPSGVGTDTLYSVLPADGTGDFDFDRSGDATRINKDGLIETVSGGLPRLNYPLIDGVVSGCPSLLLEPVRTNLIPYSDFTNAAWTKSNATVSLSSELSPMGVLNAYDVVYTSGGFLVESVSTTKTIGSSETISVFSKSDIVGTFLKFGGGTASGADVEKKEDYGNGWFRYSVTRTFTEAETGNTQLIISSTDIGLNTTLFGAMIEQGSYATSYIPTSGGIATRSAETCNNAGDVNTFNDSEGVLMAEISALAETGRISLNDSTTNNNVRFVYNSSTNVIEAILFNGTNQSSLAYSLPALGSFNKIAFKYKENDFALWVNGIEVDSQVGSGTTFTSGTLSELDFDAGSNGLVPFYGSVKQLQYFDTALTDTDLEELTTL